MELLSARSERAARLRESRRERSPWSYRRSEYVFIPPSRPSEGPQTEGVNQVHASSGALQELPLGGITICLVRASRQATGIQTRKITVVIQAVCTEYIFIPPSKPSEGPPRTEGAWESHPRVFRRSPGAAPGWNYYLLGQGEPPGYRNPDEKSHRGHIDFLSIYICRRI